MTPLNDLDVLIVGAGPVGLTLACELLRHGASCRIVEKRDAPSIHSKAAGVQARTLEMLQDMGLSDAFVAKGRQMRGANMYTGTTRLAHIAIQVPTTPFPFILGISQRETELFLEAHLESLGGRVEREVECVAFTQDDEGITADLKHADHTTSQVRALFLAGCDGAHSHVRKTLGLPFEGSTFEQRLIQTDIKIEWPFEVDDNEAYMFLSPTGAVGALPLLSEGRYRLIIMAPPEGIDETSLASYQTLVEERAPKGVRLSDPAWMIGFRFHGRVVSRYSQGRVFLAGDAAHIHSPAGAQGMNLGMQDAYNLAWKLALVARGLGKPVLLDSYDAERRPIGKSVVNTTDAGTKAMFRMMNLKNPLALGLRNQAVSLLWNTGLFQNIAFRTISGVTVGYPDSPITGQDQSPIWKSNLFADKDSEQPSLSDWWHFSKGPNPGERVPDLVFERPCLDSDTLFDVLRGESHVLLLFDGAAATPEGYQTLQAIYQAVEARCGNLVRRFLVMPEGREPKGLSEGSIQLLEDLGGALHRLFGADSECLYLIRPDGYVGYRNQPADKEGLMAFLSTLFTEQAAEKAQGEHKSR